MLIKKNTDYVLITIKKLFITNTHLTNNFSHSFLDEPNADMDNFSLLYLLKGVCLATNQEYEQAVKCFKEILYW